RAKSVRWPKVPEDQREAWPLATAQRVRGAINARYRISIVIALGCELRQGEVFGLSPENVDFARGILHVRRQVQLLGGRPYFALPKGGKARVVDMPPSVADALAEYFMDHHDLRQRPRANIFNVEVGNRPWLPPASSLCG
ncbi:MAG: site-specific integrase, partial [Streptomyces sp.]|nr:site-specific integrase [Streptomyces sp.]